MPAAPNCRRRTVRLTLAVVAGALLLSQGSVAGQSIGPVSGGGVGPASGGAAREGQRLGPPGDGVSRRPGRAGVEDKGEAPAPGADGGGASRALWSLAGVVGLILAGGVVLRALASRCGGLRAALGAGGRAPSGIMEVLGRYPLGRGTTLVLLKVDRRVLLLSQSAGGRLGLGAQFSTLCEISDPEEVASILVKARDAEGESAAERFRSLLSRFDRTMGASETGGPLRRVLGRGRDRVELLDDRRPEIPVVDLTIGAPPGGGPIGALRRRLSALRGGAP